MPSQRRCPHSGALIFDPTEDEKVLKKTIEDVASIKEENAELRQRIEQLEALVANKQ
ncbi:hypothetical protein DEAC_c14360 [Desulfosporosinus acididurans]|uniref:Uncharacterized protein n=1 Tax=Desulfosporosinus acididurans TaxID=476652 RepID=A0A0J1FUU3_9FIRM|nr:hypothetical protein [Desulfosporosinus acididurans]KLU66768.1 hypothetical protein DEAC_c14360 [Desulfosporosinus acididurans]